MASNTDSRRKKFEGTWPAVKTDILEAFATRALPDDAMDWFAQNLEYNVPGGKLNRGMSVVDSVEILQGRALTNEEYFKAAVLGWGVELLQAFFLVSDDMMDDCNMRRGQPCWYKVPKVGSIAINDAFMLEAAIYILLKKHFRSEACYVPLVELFLDATLETEIGQLLDLVTAPPHDVNLAKFTLDRHSLIVVYKTAFYSFYLPVALAMLMCDIPSDYSVAGKAVRPYDMAKSILIPLGEYFQIQDDFLDFSGTPEQIGKVGTDIRDNKCSWCINTALASADARQRVVLEQNYGRKDTECELKVKVVFDELGLRDTFARYEDDVYRRLNAQIQGVTEGSEHKLRREVFSCFLNKIYRRQK